MLSRPAGVKFECGAIFRTGECRTHYTRGRMCAFLDWDVLIASFIEVLTSPNLVYPGRNFER